MPLYWLSLSFLAGCLLGYAVTWPVLTWLALGGLILVTWVLTARLRLPLPIPLLLLGATLGAARYQLALPNLSDPSLLANFNDQEAVFQVEGVLAEPPDVRDTYTNLRIETERIRLAGEPSFQSVHGLLLAHVAFSGDWRYGDRLRLQGQLITPPEFEGFSYRDFLYRQDIYTLMDWARVERIQRGQGSPWLAAVYVLKERALSTLYRLYPDPEAALLAGILLGVENGIPRQVSQAFRDTGTAHIIAISGFNITILAGLFLKIFSRLLGRWRGALAAGIGISLYTLLVGASPSVVRAAIMGGLSLFARQVGRRQDGLNSLAFVAALMALWDPLVLWDVSFQLSFAATLGLVLYGSPSQAVVASVAGRVLPPTEAQRLASLVGEYFLFTLAALVVALPVTIYHFQRLSLSALIANPLVLPAQPAVMVLGGLAVLLGMLWLPLGQVAAYLAWPFVVYTIRMVELLGRIPGGVLVLGQVALFWVLLFYIALFSITFAANRLPPERWRPIIRKIRPSLVFFGLAVVAALVWRHVLSAPDGRLRLTVLDVSTASISGNALLIQTPGGRNLLVGGGPSTAALSDALGRRLPLNQRQLDFLIVANPAEEHIAALPDLLERFPPAQVLWAGPTHASSSARYLQTTMSEAGIVPFTAQSGQTLDLDHGAVLHVLSANQRGAVLLL
jgi:competence protein ComEC